MKELIARLIRDYGAATTLVFNGTNTYRHTRAFLRLVTSKSWQNMERMIPDCGEIPRGQFLYIGPPELMLNGGDFVVYDTRTFIVRRADAIVFRNDRLFVWGLCVETGEDAGW